MNRISRILPLALVLSSAQLMLQADQYSVSISPNSQTIAAFSLQTTNIGSAVFGAADGTTVYTWNAANQNYNSPSTYYAPPGAWYPDISLHTAEGFIIQNPTASNLVLTLRGAPVFSNSYTVYFPSTNYWYLVGPAFATNLPYGNFLECLPNGTNTVFSLNYHGRTGDQVSFYKWGTSVVETRYMTNGQPGWTGETLWTSPSFPAGVGFWLKPTAGTTWTQMRTGSRCQ